MPSIRLGFHNNSPQTRKFKQQKFICCNSGIGRLVSRYWVTRFLVGTLWHAENYHWTSTSSCCLLGAFPWHRGILLTVSFLSPKFTNPIKFSHNLMKPGLSLKVIALVITILQATAAAQDVWGKTLSSTRSKGSNIIWLSSRLGVLTTGINRYWHVRYKRFPL